MKRRNLLLALLAFALVLGAAIGPAMAYFSTYTSARGGITIHLGDETEIHEDWLDWTKHISVMNTEGQPVFIRARAYSGQTYPATTYSDTWEFRADETGGWWYYPAPVAAGETASGLSVQVSKIPAGMGEAYETLVGENFNVVVVYESTPVQYDASGNAYADWSMILDSVTEGGQG